MPTRSGSASSPRSKRKDPRFAFVQRPEFRQAISHAVDREAFAETVFLGAAVPVWGPITPGNTPLVLARHPALPAQRRRRARAAQEHRPRGPQRQRRRRGCAGHRGALHGDHAAGRRLVRARHRRAARRAARVGIALDIAPLELGAMIQRLHGVRLRRDLHAPALHRPRPGRQHRLLAQLRRHALLEHVAADARHGVGAAHRHASCSSRRRRSTRRAAQLFSDVQRILAENLPVLYFARPMYCAHSARLPASSRHAPCCGAHVSVRHIGAAAAGVWPRDSPSGRRDCWARRQPAASRSMADARFLVRRLSLPCCSSSRSRRPR